MNATLCELCHEQITNQASGSTGSGIEFQHRAGGDREPEYIASRIHLHRVCLEHMKQGRFTAEAKSIR